MFTFRLGRLSTVQLSLNNNHIGDAGAIALGKALVSNRTLIHV